MPFSQTKKYFLLETLTVHKKALSAYLFPRDCNYKKIELFAKSQLFQRCIEHFFENSQKIFKNARISDTNDNFLP